MVKITFLAAVLETGLNIRIQVTISMSHQKSFIFQSYNLIQQLNVVENIVANAQIPMRGLAHSPRAFV